MNTLRADFDQPLAAVHQTSSPGPGAEPVLGLQALAVEVALAVDDRLRLAGGAAREGDQARDPRAAQLGGRRRLRRGEQRARRARRATLGHARGDRPSARAPRARRGCARRRRSAAGSATSIRSARSFARSCSVHGSATAPMRKQASSAKTHSGRLPISVITTSPRPIPRAASAPARRALRSETSPKVHSRREPSRASSTSASSRGGQPVEDVARRSSAQVFCATAECRSQRTSCRDAQAAQATWSCRPRWP